MLTIMLNQDHMGHFIYLALIFHHMLFDSLIKGIITAIVIVILVYILYLVVSALIPLI